VLERRLAEAEEASAVAVHPDAVKLYLAAVDGLKETLVERDALPERRLLQTLIKSVVVLPEGGYEIKGRLAPLSWARQQWGGVRVGAVEGA